MVPDIGHVVSMMIRQMERSSIFSEANFVSHQQFCISKNPVVLDDLVYLSPKKDQIFPEKGPKRNESNATRVHFQRMLALYLKLPGGVSIRVLMISRLGLFHRE